MSYNGNGVFLINTAGQPVVANTVISATTFNLLTADLANGLTNAITKDGQTTVTANIPMSNFKITGLGAATAANDAVRLEQITSGSTAASFTSITDSGNLTFTGTGNRITGDFSNAMPANRVAFQTSTTNGATQIAFIPNGTGTASAFELYNGSDPANAQVGQLLQNANEFRISATYRGTPLSGTYLPMTFSTGGSEAMRITTDRAVAIGTTSPVGASFAKLEVNNNIFARPTTTAQASEVKAAASDFLSLPSFTNTGVKQYGITATGTTVGLSNAGLGVLEFINTSVGLIYTNSSAPLVFGTNGQERARITSDGNLLVGTTSKLGGGLSGIDINSATYSAVTFGTGGTARGYVYANAVSSRMQIESIAGWSIAVISGGSGGVTLANGATSWASLSDERQKDIIEPIANAATKVATLRAVIGKYKTDEEGTRRSFLIAQDVDAVLPEAVDKNDPDNWALRYTEIVPLLVAAFTELKAEFDAYKLSHP